jgi:methyltransferase (TIGR00027 family)
MIQSQASQTAEFMALFRALESARLPEKRLFEDPYAKGFLKPSLRFVVRLSRIPALGAWVPGRIDHRWPGARTSGVARTRLIDDMLIRALRDGIEQVAIMGAGFDSRAYRIPGIERARVFEIDHSDTLAAKRERLQRMLGALPAHVVFVEIDFNRQSLEEVLKAASFDSKLPTFFIWEGVTNYLTAQAVDATLRFVSSNAAGSQIVFTYVHSEVLDNPAGFDGTRTLTRTLQRLGEPWTFGLDPAELPGYLKARGLELVEDIGSVEYRKRYMGSDPRHTRGYEFYRAALARVRGD